MGDGLDVAAFRELLSPAGQRLLAGIDPGEPDITVLTRLRRAHPAELAAAALTVARLRDRARDKFGADAGRMYFTRTGLEQATRQVVAAHRARRLAAGLPPGATVVDLCCGIGADAVAFARAGLAVRAVEADPLTAEVARANLAALGLAGRAEVSVGDARGVPITGRDAAFCDPARRTGGRRVFDPAGYSPPWPEVLALAGRAGAACLKVAPGIAHELIPPGVRAEWVSVRGEVKEAALWFGRLAGPGGREATVLPAGATLRSRGGTGGADRPPVAPPRRYLYEPDGAVVRAHLVGELADLVGGALLDPRIAYVTADRLVALPYARPYEIDDVLPFSVKRLRAALRERDVGTVTIMKRGSAVDVDRLRRDLRPAGAGRAVVALTRIGRRPYALLCRPAVPH